MRWMIGVVLALTVPSILPPNNVPTDSDIIGQWATPEASAGVEIYRATDSTFEGRICWLKEPNYPADDKEGNKPKHDRENPDKSLQSRPIIGLLIMKGVKFDGEEQWTGGTVYNPESGKELKCKLRLIDKSTLAVRSFVGISLFGRTEEWVRCTPPAK